MQDDFEGKRELLINMWFISFRKEKEENTHHYMRKLEISPH